MLKHDVRPTFPAALLVAWLDILLMCIAVDYCCQLIIAHLCDLLLVNLR
jgi:hypothetical protein